MSELKQESLFSDCTFCTRRKAVERKETLKIQE
jgi:hypothetical protein